MKIYNDQTNKDLHPDLQKSLSEFRFQRGFDEKIYLEKKISLLNEYMRVCGLKACVVGVSGGIDSAVTLGIVNAASKVETSPIKKIIPVFLPVFSKESATNQEGTISRGSDVVRSFGLDPVQVDLTQVHALMKKTTDTALHFAGANWSSGQLVSYMRTPALYYITSLLSEMSLPAILCGTTNRDEGAYIGYFGKASDGMVDVQIISDIHKSEVYRMGRVLGIPESVKKAIPSGDMYDGRPDEEVFGATYDFVEFYMYYLSLNSPEDKHHLKRNWSEEAVKQFELLSSRIESMHSYNKHKYLGKNPSVHFDVYERFVPGGWMD